jgi:hypothetical protein
MRRPIIFIVSALFIIGSINASASVISLDECMQEWTGELLSLKNPMSPWRTDLILNYLHLKIGVSLREDVLRSVAPLTCNRSDHGAFMAEHPGRVGLSVWVSDADQIQVHEILFVFDGAGRLARRPKGIEDLAPIGMKKFMVPTQ